jgi:hypothetical protein
LDTSSLYVDDEDSSGEEMVNNKFVDDTSLGVSDFHSRLLADTASRRKLKAREALTVPFHFLCDYADKSDQHMSFIGRKLEILKGEITLYHEKVNKCRSIQRVKNWLVWRPVVFHWKKSELGPGGDPQIWMA